MIDLFFDIENISLAIQSVKELDSDWIEVLAISDSGDCYKKIMCKDENPYHEGMGIINEPKHEWQYEKGE